MVQFWKEEKPSAVQPPRSRNQIIFWVVMLALAIGTLMIGFNLFEPTKKILIAPPQKINPVQVAPTVGTMVDDFSATNSAKKIVGIVSGHKGYDPGAACDDGLTEAVINYSVAVEVVDLLNRRGIQTDLLNEFDDRLKGYKADALVSIHADSCNVAGASGFKVARVTDSAIPQAEDHLVACLNQEYGRYTGLPQHPGSITDNMTDYHAFREIDAQTPGAIIEIGFLLDDRVILETKPKIIARGIAAGIICFLGQ